MTTHLDDALSRQAWARAEATPRSTPFSPRAGPPRSHHVGRGPYAGKLGYLSQIPNRRSEPEEAG